MDKLYVENANTIVRELDPSEIDAVSGGVSDDAVYGASLGAAGGFLAIGIGVAALTPVGMGIMLGASIVSSGVAIYTAAQ